MTALIARAALLLCLLSTTRADFTGASFDSVSEGSSLNLTWDNTGLDADAFPLIVFVSLINQTAGHDVFGLKTNLSSKSATWCHPGHLSDTITDIVQTVNSLGKHRLVHMARPALSSAIPDHGSVSSRGAPFTLQEGRRPDRYSKVALLLHQAEDRGRLWSFIWRCKFHDGPPI